MRLLPLLPFFTLTTTSAKRTWGVTSTPTTLINQTFDYIVVGGGLAGITVAARLSENPLISVLLIEAGNDDRKDERVYDLYKYGSAFGSELVWNWPTDWGRTMPGGKTLGGGTSVNGMAYTRGLAAQYDAWSTLLEPSEANAGWDWNGLWGYMKKSESFTPPTTNQTLLGADYIPSYHGTTGPVQVTYTTEMFTGPQQGAFVDTITNLTGIKHYKDLNGGTPGCVSFTPMTINHHENDHRSSSAAAYLTPVEGLRKNWVTLVGHQVTKINFANPGSIPLTASGVQFAPRKGSTSTKVRYEAKARREVILAAGAIMTPALLQLSGIGPPNLLSQFQIPVLLNQPNIGTNLQEQTLSIFGANAVESYNPGGRGPSDVIAFPNIYELFSPNKNNQSRVREVIKRIDEGLDGWAKKFGGGDKVREDALKVIFGVQRDLIVKERAPVVELFFSSGYPAALGFLMWPLLPFSRGSVKITSSDPFTLPFVNVNYFGVDYDLDMQVEGARLARRVLSAPPLGKLSAGEVIPGSAVPDDAINRGSDTAWKNWIRNQFVAVAHPVGTAAMMRRDLGGVVDAQLKVYDTTNLRIVDASVMPMQISAHLSATLYGVAEKAADLIKADQ